MDNDLITFAGHIHNTLAVMLKKYTEGRQLTEDEEQILWELHVCREENMLPTIENKYKP